jgi:hypothetical protein
MTAAAHQQPLFYKHVVPLNMEQHRNLYIDPEPGYRFAREANCVYIAGIEFPNACREYPIVFAGGGDGGLVPVALLGLKNDENLFLDNGNNWTGGYIPAYVRRYPFILAADSTGENFAVCIDETYAGFNTAREGEPLITESGEHGALLKRSVEFLKDYQRHAQITTEFCKTLKALDLLEPVQANIEMKSGEKFALAGFGCVNRDKLKALSGEQLKDLVTRNYADLIYAHLLSLANMNALLDRMAKRSEGRKRSSKKS